MNLAAVATRRLFPLATTALAFLLPAAATASTVWTADALRREIDLARDFEAVTQALESASSGTWHRRYTTRPEGLDLLRELLPRLLEIFARSPRQRIELASSILEAAGRILEACPRVVSLSRSTRIISDIGALKAPRALRSLGKALLSIDPPPIEALAGAITGLYDLALEHPSGGGYLELGDVQLLAELLEPEAWLEVVRGRAERIRVRRSFEIPYHPSEAYFRDRPAFRAGDGGGGVLRTLAARGAPPAVLREGADILVRVHFLEESPAARLHGGRILQGIDAQALQDLAVVLPDPQRDDFIRDHVYDLVPVFSGLGSARSVGARGASRGAETSTEDSYSRTYRRGELEVLAAWVDRFKSRLEPPVATALAVQAYLRIDPGRDGHRRGAAAPLPLWLLEDLSSGDPSFRVPLVTALVPACRDLTGAALASFADSRRAAGWSGEQVAGVLEAARREQDRRRAAADGREEERALYPRWIRSFARWKVPGRLVQAGDEEAGDGASYVLSRERRVRAGSSLLGSQYWAREYHISRRDGTRVATFLVAEGADTVTSFRWSFAARVRRMVGVRP